MPEDPTKPWFKAIPVGKNRLNVMLKEMCAEAGIITNHTNHSLRTYGATTMFQAGVPEKLIKQRTGHRSLQSLHQHEHTCESQLLDVSNVVSCDQDSNKEVSATKSQHSTAADIVPYKDPSPHQMLAAAQSTSNAASSCSTMKEPLRPTFIFNSCNFSSCPLLLLEVLIRVQKKLMTWMVYLKGYLLNSYLTVKGMNSSCTYRLVKHLEYNFTLILL